MTVVWTQWPDLKLPAGVTHLPTDGIAPAAGDLDKVEFYVPRYMGGPAAIAMIPDMKGLKIIQSPNAGVDVILTLPMFFSTPLRSERYKREVKCAGEKKVSGVGFRHGMDYQRSGTHGDSLLC